MLLDFFLFGSNRPTRRTSLLLWEGCAFFRSRSAPLPLRVSARGESEPQELAPIAGALPQSSRISQGQGWQPSGAAAGPARRGWAARTRRALGPGRRRGGPVEGPRSSSSAMIRPQLPRPTADLAGGGRGPAGAPESGEWLILLGACLLGSKPPCTQGGLLPSKKVCMH